MKRLVISSTIAALVAGGAGFAFAAPGPNGHNNYGLCIAYFAGSQTGQDHKHNANPFVELQNQAGDADGDGTPGEPTDVAQWCMDNGQTPGGDTHGKSGH